MVHGHEVKRLPQATVNLHHIIPDTVSRLLRLQFMATENGHTFKKAVKFTRMYILTRFMVLGVKCT